MEKKTKYKWSMAITIIVALVYVLIPTDIVPDMVPVLGWLDDSAAILLAIANAVRLGLKMRSH